MFKFFARCANFFLGKSFQNNNLFVSSSLKYLHRERHLDQNYFDYIRLATLELVSNEINSKNLQGNVAELGVYKGKFARYLNLYFGERRLYLFDTFEGFDERDVQVEKKEGFSSGSQSFADTSVESVLKLMPHKENCIPVKGFFPESAKNIQDQFVFVSIDTDLYEPIYEGLKFFYPLLASGGYIFVHDFNNDNYPGTRKAVEKFCAEKNISFVPLPDLAGSAIICK
jgi:O-methyltransferase